MANAAAWFMFFLGVAHIVFGLVKYQAPVTSALAAGYVGKFATPEVRRTAFWFLIFGPLVMLTGHVAIHAVAQGDLALLRILGVYALVTGLLGTAAFPKSPFWAILVAAPVLITSGYGLLP